MHKHIQKYSLSLSLVYTWSFSLSYITSNAALGYVKWRCFT
jgi:hypothetical protein